jgi:CheY-like chemotaxis protein
MAAGRQERKRILVVDDCPATREMLTIILEVEGFEVVGAENGEQAVRGVQGAPRPDLILLDLMMPVMTGWEFLEWRKQDARSASIPVIIFTGIDDAAPDLGALGAAACIAKPITEDSLIDRVAITVNAVLAKHAPLPAPGERP